MLSDPYRPASLLWIDFSKKTNVQRQREGRTVKGPPSRFRMNFVKCIEGSKLRVPDLRVSMTSHKEPPVGISNGMIFAESSHFGETRIVGTDVEKPHIAGSAEGNPGSIFRINC
jgi:hypothetical protein